jgi:hypothetical protein
MNNRQTRGSTTRRYVARTEAENASIAVIPPEQRGTGPRVKAPPAPPSDLVKQVQDARRAARKAAVKANKHLRR